MTQVQWSSEAQKVIVTGTFDGWAGTLLLTRNDTGVFSATLPSHDWPLVFKFIVDGEWMVSKDYATQVDDLGNINNILPFDQGHQETIVKNNVSKLDLKQISALPAIPEEASPQIRNLALPEIIITDTAGVSATLKGKEIERKSPGQVPKIVLTDVEGKSSLLNNTPSIVITDVYGHERHLSADLLESTRYPTVNSFSETSFKSMDSDATLNINEDEELKSTKRSKKHTKNPLKRLTKSTSRLFQSVKQSFVRRSPK